MVTLEVGCGVDAFHNLVGGVVEQDFCCGGRRGRDAGGEVGEDGGVGGAGGGFVVCVRGGGDEGGCYVDCGERGGGWGGRSIKGVESWAEGEERGGNWWRCGDGDGAGGGDC